MFRICEAYWCVHRLSLYSLGLVGFTTLFVHSAGCCARSDECLCDDESILELLHEDHQAAAFLKGDTHALEPREARFAAYQTVRKVLGFYGKRQQLPVCIVALIRHVFPDAGGQYTGFIMEPSRSC